MAQTSGMARHQGRYGSVTQPSPSLCLPTALQGRHTHTRTHTHTQTHTHTHNQCAFGEVMGQLRGEHPSGQLPAGGQGGREGRGVSTRTHTHTHTTHTPHQTTPHTQTTPHQPR